MKKLFTLVFTVLSCITVQSQNRSCGTMQHLDEIRQNDPKVDMRMQSENTAIKNWISNNSKSTPTILTIPVVVHVIYKTSSQNISTAQILSQIDILNEDFRKNNSDASSVPSAFAGVAADSEIEFCLAVRDPSGNVTTGITRTSTTTSSFSGYTSMKYSSSGGQDAWNTSNYLNIWVCNLSSGLLGFATFPGGNSSTDGVVCDYAYFGNTGTATYPYHLGRTATHEVGHWLNLYHIWGDSYCGNDQVSDTPKHEESNYGCPSFPHASSCSGTGSNGEMFMNYMDYTNDACMYMFSTGQKNRMRATLAGSRSSLLSSNGCTAVFTPFTLSATVKNVSCNSANIGVSNDGNINLSVTGGTAPYTYSWSNGATTQDISNLIAGSYSISVTDAVGQVETAYYTVLSPSTISVTYTVTSTSAPGVSDGAVNVNVSGGTTPLSYYWDNSASGYSATTQDLSNVLAGTYAYYVIDDNGCYELYSIVVPEGQLVPLAVTDNVSNISCFGYNDGAIDLTVSGGATPYSFSWSNGASTEDLSGLTSGTYSVTITDAQSQTFSAAYTVSEPSQLTATYTVSDVTTAGGNDGAIDLSPTGGVSPYNFYWSTGQNTEDLSNLIAGTYDVWLVDANMCYMNVVVNVNEMISGCTDPTAGNYDASATVDDGSCTSPPFACAKPVPTGIYIDEIIQVQAKIHWDDMSSATCMALKYYVNVREVGTTSWSWRVAQDAGLCNQGLPTTSKVMIYLTAATDYEYRVKAFYCNTTGSSAWSPMGYFTTADECPNVTNLIATPGPQTNRVIFSWDAPSAYEFVRIKLRVDSISSPQGYDWVQAGGFGVNYPALSVSKWGLVAGETYRGQARTWCNPAGGLYRSDNWTSLIWWTQPASVRLEGGAAINNLDVYPNPSRDIFNISFTSEQVQNLKVRILNVIGEVLVTESLEQFIGEYTKQINLKEYSKGIYFLEIKTDAGIINKKLILQ